jgi:hypothetical protein
MRRGTPTPNVDPGIHVPVLEPQSNTTPMILPSGTPGGDPRVQQRSGMRIGASQATDRPGVTFAAGETTSASNWTTVG